MFIIIRRLFNPPEGKVNIEQFVAKFAPHAEKEANLLLARLQELSTSFKTNDFSEWRYTLKKDIPAPMAASEGKGIQVDVSKARSTKRPIAFEYSYHKEPDGTCSCLAHHKLYGAIRGEVEDSAAGRALFIRRVTAVWPNATLTAK